MSTAAKQFHEEEAIGKTYDFQIARRLLRYLKPYLRLLIPALVLTFALNLLGILQPKFTQYAIDWYILPKQADGLMLLVGLFAGVQLLRLIFSYLQAVLLNTVGQYVMFDIRRELYDKLQHQEVAYYDRNPVGRIMTRLTNDVDALNELFTAGRYRCSRRPGHDRRDHRRDALDGRAVDTDNAVNCAAAFRGHYLVSQRCAARLRHGQDANCAHQCISAGTFCRRADSSDLQC